MLEGSVRRADNQVRVNTQLIDAESDTHLWAEHFDYRVGDLFALQSEITSRIASTLQVELLAAEATWPTENPARSTITTWRRRNMDAAIARHFRRVDWARARVGA